MFLLLTHTHTHLQNVSRAHTRTQKDQVKSQIHALNTGNSEEKKISFKRECIYVSHSPYFWSLQSLFVRFVCAGVDSIH